ncbi:MAG: hypothetical protein R3F37_14075 [Candidatus Competibacteraceae bacterium]
MISPDRLEWTRKFAVLEQRLATVMTRRLASDKQRLGCWNRR